MQPTSFDEAWAQHDAAEKASIQFARRNVTPSAGGRTSKAASSVKTRR